MADLILRDYQARLVEDIRTAWARTRSVIAWAPTGAGKTEIAVYLAKAEESQHGSTLFVVDRKTLAGQARQRYGMKYGMLTGLLRGEDTFIRGYEPALIATVQTLKARWDHPEVKAALDRITLVVIDEAHIRFRHHQAVIEQLPNARILGLSATPLRDGLGLIFGELVKGPSYDRLIEAGHLVRARYFVPHAEDVADALDGVGVASTGDYVNAQLSALMRQRTIIGDVVETWREKSEGRPTICFAVDIAHSKALCDGFLQAGTPAEHIDLRTSEDDRAAMFQRFRSGRTKVLCSIVVLGVGFDAPNAACAILARPTLSLTMHVQQVGRVLRACEGKSDALILDHSGNVLRHGKVEDFEPPPLSEIDKRTDKVSKTHVSDFFPCSECRAVMPPGQRVCHECGHEIARRNTVDHVPGKLIEEGGKRERMTQAELRGLYLELRFMAKARGYKEGWAYYKLREHFDFKAPYDWKSLSPSRPTTRTTNLVLSWSIAFAKRRQKERRAQAVAHACPACGSIEQTRGPGTGPHQARLQCGGCGHFLRWLPASGAGAISSGHTTTEAGAG